MASFRTSSAWGLLIVIALSGARPAQAASFAGGTGEPNDPYQIATAEQLVSIGSDPNLLDKHFILVADIDLDPNLPGGRVFDRAIIAPPSRAGGFCGYFDAQGHVIKNITLHGGTERYLGFFGSIESTARVCNLGLENVRIRSPEGAGGLACDNSGTIENCYVTGSIRCHFGGGGLVGWNDWGGSVTHCHAEVDITGDDGADSIGGLVGYSTGTIVTSYATGSVTAGQRSWGVGGLVGMMGSFGCLITPERGLIVNCYAAGRVSSGDKSWYVGGLAGLSSEGTVVQCYAVGPVVAGRDSCGVGGLAGGNGAPGGFAGGPGIHMGLIVNCYAAGRVSCGDGVAGGGLVGENFDGTVINSFWDVEASGRPSSEGGTGLTTASMAGAQVFLEAGWDWVGERSNGVADVWLTPRAGGYPVLAAFSDEYEPRALEGTGTRDDPYRIATVEDLGAICHYRSSAWYALTRDIDLEGITWATAPVHDLQGGFLGNGYVVRHLCIRGGGHLGLFGAVGTHATVMDLRLAEADITGAEHGACLGVLAAMSTGHIVRCGGEGTIAAGDSSRHIGGLLGAAEGEVSQSRASVRIAAGQAVGAVGGLIGTNTWTVDIRDSYARGAIAAGRHSSAVGALLGSLDRGTILSCYAAVSLTREGSEEGGGGLVGAPWESVIRDCYYLVSPLGVGPQTSGLPLTDEQMKRQLSFLGWDFGKVWTICEGRDYPRLRWERVQCEP